MRNNITLRKNLNRQMSAEEMDNNLDTLMRYLNRYESGKKYSREEIVIIESGSNFQLAVCNVAENELSQTFFDPSEWLTFSSDTVNTGDNSYIRNTPIPLTLGGAIAGSTFDDTLQGALDKILYPFISANLSFTTNTLREKGVNQNIELIVNITPNSNIITGRNIKVGATTLFTGVTNSFTYTDNNISNTKTYTLEVLTQNSGVINKNLTVDFVPATYHGSFDGLANETEIKNLNKSILRKEDLTLSFNPTLQNFYFAYPASFGLLTKIIDPNGFNIIDGWEYRTEDFTLANTFLESYNIYSSKTITTQNNFQITFKF